LHYLGLRRRLGQVTSVCSHSFLNIAATGAIDARKGLFLDGKQHHGGGFPHKTPYSRRTSQLPLYSPRICTGAPSRPFCWQLEPGFYKSLSLPRGRYISLPARPFGNVTKALPANHSPIGFLASTMFLTGISVSYLCLGLHGLGLCAHILEVG